MIKSRIIKNCIKRDLYYLITRKNCLISIATFALMSTYITTVLNIPQYSVSIWDLIIFNFSGPLKNDDLLVDFLQWFIPIILYMFFIVKFIYNEWEGRYLYSLIRIKSLSKWIISKIIAVSIFSILYCGIFYIITFLLGIIKKFPITKSTSLTLTQNIIFCGRESIDTLTFYMFALSCITLIVVSLILIFLSLVIKKSIYSYFIMCFIMFQPYLSRIIPNNIRLWLLGEQCMFSRHNIMDNEMPYFTIAWSLKYIIIVSAVMIILIYTILKRKDFI